MNKKGEEDLSDNNPLALSDSVGSSHVSVGMCVCG